MIEKEVKLYIGAPKGITPPIRISQYDTEWRFVFTIYNGDEVWHPDDVVLCAMTGLKPDGTAFLYNGNITSTNYVVDCSKQITSVEGDVLCELRFSNTAGRIVNTVNFKIIVEKAPLKGYVASKSEFSAINQLINNALDLIATTNKIATVQEVKEYFHIL